MSERFMDTPGQPELEQDLHERESKPVQEELILKVGKREFAIPMEWLMERTRDLFPKFAIQKDQTPDSLEFFIVNSLGAEMSDKIKIPKTEIHEQAIWRAIVRIVREEINTMYPNRKEIVRKYQSRKQ